MNDLRAFVQKFPLSFRVTFMSAVLFGGVLLCVYADSQQVLRQSANDPQIQIAEDIAMHANAGTDPRTLIPAIQIDVSKSLAPFATIFDDSGKVLASSGLIGTTPVVPPTGVFEYVRAHGEDVLTLEPASGVRLASVMTRYKNSTTSSGFILVGRNLREVEHRSFHLFQMTLLTFLAAVISTFVLTWFLF